MIAPVTESAALVVDPQLAAAVEVARQVLAEDVPNDAIGDHRGRSRRRTNRHSLVRMPESSYVGWRWAMNVTRVPDSDVVTVNETVLLPGNGSLLSPQWLPWDERVEAGDLGVGDVLPTTPDDVRLVPMAIPASIKTTPRTTIRSRDVGVRPRKGARAVGRRP